MDIESLERAELRKKRILVAVLFVLSLALALVFASWMGALGIGPTKTLHVSYDFAGGIDRGSPVRLGGIRVGRVSEIVFSPGESALVKLKLEINNDAFGKITEDSKFYVNLAGLIGERYVEVVPGQGALVKIGQHLRGIDPPRVDQLISQGYGIFGDLRELLNENKGDLKDMFASLNELAKNLNKLMGGLTAGQRKELDTLLRNLAAASGDLRETLALVAAAGRRMDQTGGRETWTQLQGVVRKADAIQLNDIRRLILEDGVKVNFSSKKPEENPWNVVPTGGRKTSGN
jgi:phospholipid/cholesterol/gamma-HCH transport system substrate-binding protein